MQTEENIQMRQKKLANFIFRRNFFVYCLIHIKQISLRDITIQFEINEANKKWVEFVFFI